MTCSTCYKSTGRASHDVFDLRKGLSGFGGAGNCGKPSESEVGQKPFQTGQIGAPIAGLIRARASRMWCSTQMEFIIK